MLKKIGDAFTMQRRVKKVQKELAKQAIEVETEGGALVLTVNGMGNPLDFHTEDELWADQPRCKKALIRAFTKGRAVAEKMMAEKMKEAGIGLPGLGG